MTKPRINVKRKQSVYLDRDLQTAIANELAGEWDRGYTDTTISAIIKKRLRQAYGIPGAKRYDK